MDAAVNALDRALNGDGGALSFLERTASIYVLDATNPAHPKTYGCWDFLNQALNEIERLESTYQREAAYGGRAPSYRNLAPHVQLLTSLSRRAARRPPPSDRALIRMCLTNAAQSGALPAAGSECVAWGLIDLNCQTRERVMGRIAAIAFDFAFHAPRGGGRPAAPPSAFADPLSMEGLCTIVAANSVSSGPGAFRHLVMDWIVPSAENLPPMAVAAVAAHLANEAAGRAAPAGTADALKAMFEPVVSGILAPFLADAVRESDVSEGGVVGPSRNQRLAAMVIRALERWSAATGSGILQIKRVCAGNGAKTNIIEVLSDVLYSHAEIVIDAAAELFDTLLRRGVEDEAALQGMAIVSSLMMISSLQSTEHLMRDEEVEREGILAELLSAVGLQRFRFVAATQVGGSPAVCRCLVRIAASMAIASQAAIRSGRLRDSANGLMELLIKAAAHPSIHVCGIALEALPLLITAGTDFSIRLLPILQQKAIVPSSLRGVRSVQGTLDCAVDFHEYANFREHLLSTALVACYKGNRVFFVESCAAAIDEFCSTAATPQLPYQLEAALFCLSAVSMEASKRALLVNASPAAQAAAAKVSSLQKCQVETLEISEDSQRHDNELARCTAALLKNPANATANPLTLAQMCRFLGKYASWYAKTPSAGSLDGAAELALKSFNLAATGFADDMLAREMIREMSISPIAEAATALRNILTRSPARFATPEALSALGSGWESSYASANSNDQRIKIELEDREALCSGICRVLAALPHDRWTSSLTSLAQPTIECLEQVTKKADEHLGAAQSKPDNLSRFITRVADEIHLLSVMIRTFKNAAMKSKERAVVDEPAAVGAGDPDVSLIAVLQRPWPCLSHIASKFSSHEPISAALGDFLTVTVSVQERNGANLSVFRDACDMASGIMATVHRGEGGSSHAPMLQFVREAIEVHGHLAEIDVCSAAAEAPSSSPRNNEIRRIIERLLTLAFEFVRPATGDLWSHGMEQGHGEQPFEASPKLEPKEGVESPDEVSSMFSILTVCVERCPVLFVQLPLRYGSDQEDHGLFIRSVAAAALSLNEKEADVARDAILFLKSLINMKASMNAFGLRLQLIGGVVDSTLAKVRRGVIATLISGACGVFPREILDPAAALLYYMLKTSPPEEAEASAITGLQQEQFRVGAEARNVTLAVFASCACGTYPISTLMEFTADLWQLHQSDDTSAVAGGDEVIRFSKKYHSQKKKSSLK